MGVEENSRLGTIGRVSHQLPGGSDNEQSIYKAGDPALIPGSGRSPEEGNGYPLQYFAWRIPWREEAGGLQSIGSQRVWPL